MALTRGKLQQCDEFADSVINLLKNSSIQSLISEIIKSEVATLHDKIEDLQAEVKNLRESNIDLIRLLTEGGESLNKKKPININYENCKLSDVTNMDIKQIDKKVPDKEKPKKLANKFIGTDKSINVEPNKTIFNKDTPDGHNTDKQTIQKRRQIMRVFGSASLTETGNGHKLSAVAKRSWLYVGRATNGTTAAEMQNYLEEKFPKNEFTVELLPKWKNATSECFKVGVDPELLPELFKGDTWPKGLLVKNYTFFRDSK